MTDKNTELPQKKQPETASATPRPESTARPAPAGNKPNAKRRNLAWRVLVVAVLVIVVLAFALWYQQKQFKAYTAQLEQQAGSSAGDARQASQQSQQALAQAQKQQTQIAALQRALDDSREQLSGLEQAFQLITDSGSELVLLNDVDHLVTIAQQQLQLGGNVANAIISLETAQAQLARANRPGLASLQQTINGDLDHLRAASTIDIALISSQLDEFSNLLGQAPLLVPDDAAPLPVQPQADASDASDRANSTMAADESGTAQAGPWWRRGLDVAGSWSKQAWHSVSKDLGNFIDVRRVDDASALLMSPDQATRFRDNLRLRIMTAQLALMMHQPGIWKAETEALLQAVEGRYDPKSAQTRQALKLARQFADTPIDVRLPTVDNSLQAIEVLREARDHQSQDGPAQPGPTDGMPAAPAGNSDVAPQEAVPDTGSGDTAPATDNGEAGAPPDSAAPASDERAPEPSDSVSSDAPGASATDVSTPAAASSGKSSARAAHAWRAGISSSNQS